MKTLPKKIGIWGLGVGGSSILSYLTAIKKSGISVFDKRPFTDQEKTFFAANNIHAFAEDEVHSFLERNDAIIPSAGVDLRPYTQWSHKWLSEVDIFFTAWQKKSIAITGSVGKTTITQTLTELLNAAGTRAYAGGNIGKGMLDLIPMEETVDCAVLELSSFQLEYAHHCTPDLAIITNIYPNHLDRHESMEAYTAAKLHISTQQKPGQHCLLPWSLARNHQTRTRSSSHSWFSELHPRDFDPILLGTDTLYFFSTTGSICKQQSSIVTVLCRAPAVPSVSFKENWLIIAAALDICGHNFSELAATAQEIALPQHRFSKIAEHAGIHFYNDSKSTVPQATLSAVAALAPKPILLFLGGISKGVNREELIVQLKKSSVKHILCFGAEAEELYAWCLSYNIPATSGKTLDEAFAQALKIAQPDDQVLFSPAGASFDLFKNYQDRGNTFIKLVQSLK